MTRDLLRSRECRADRPTEPNCPPCSRSPRVGEPVGGDAASNKYCPGEIDKLALLPLVFNTARAAAAPPVPAVAAFAAPENVAGLPPCSKIGETAGSSSITRGVPLVMVPTALVVVALRSGAPAIFSSEAGPLVQVRMNTPRKVVAQP